MNKRVQFITTPGGERLVVLPEAEYKLLLAAAEDEEEEISPEFAAELQRRREAIDRGEFVVYKPGAEKQAE